jgi:hypothetical protein
MLVAMAALIALPANAQEITRWVAPSGAFSIDPHAWRALDPVADAQYYEAGQTLIVVPQGEITGESLCSVEAIAQPAPGPVSRDRMNEATRRLAQSPTIQNMGAPGGPFTTERIETPDVDGVTVLDVYGQFRSLDTVQRRFFLLSDGVVSLYTFSCSVVSDDQEAVAQGHAIAASLRFHGVGHSL